MSAIIDRAPISDMQLDGIRRYHTRIKVIVHSHNHDEPIYLSDDVVSCQTSKNIKGIGRANLALTPRKNYLNLLYPNDVINIYFDTGNGQGWTRTFLGYIDRVEEEHKIEKDGSAHSVYHVIASDFQKVVEKTQVYFNPELSGRRDISGSDFATVNIGGLAMLMKGLQVSGSPADCVLSLLMLQLGYGSQWILPDSYRPYIDERFRQLRQEYAQNRLLNTVKNRLSVETYNRLKQLVESGELERLRENATAQAAQQQQSRTSTEEQVQNSLNDPTFGNSFRGANPNAPSELDDLSRAIFSRDLNEAIRGTDGNGEDLSTVAAPVNGYFNTFSNDGATGASILDIMNIVDFVERKTIEGYALDTSVWDRQGPLSQIVRSVSNETINELFYDLRPMNVDGELQEGTEWDRTSDEIGGNLPDESTDNAGVRMVPAVIMREYPFNTIRNIDASNVVLERSAESTESATTLGVVWFGAIFSNRPNEPGRHIVSIPTLNAEDRVSERAGDFGDKHLDVAVISETEITASRLGRSDNDHFNLLGMWSDNLLGVAHKFFMKDFSPIITPIHITRHGLRVREVSTRFARFGPSVARQLIPGATQEERGEAGVDEEQEQEDRLERTLVPPVTAPPAGHVLRFNNRGSSKYGYRPTTRSGAGFWHFHNGIDIGIRPRVDNEQDVVAIADGYIVCSAPSGVITLYGNYIVIEHPQFEINGKKVFSVYAHLASRDPITGNQRGGTPTNPGSRAKRSCIAKGYHRACERDSDFEKIYVERGTVIGKMGRTAGTRSNPEATFRSRGVHLHFEINYGNFPSKSLSTLDVPYSDEDRVARIAELSSRTNPEAWIAEVPVPRSGPAPTATSNKSVDPVAFFADNGVPDLVAAISELNPSNEVEELIIEDEEGGGEGLPEPQDEAAGSAQENLDDDEQQTAVNGVATGIEGVVDSGLTRRVLGRWILLQDHWFQHNLEYLSGQITMRGAPEIRVGYRLDIAERHMSFYVEGVNHSWSYTNEMRTSLQVTRGQPNNPYPAYAVPPTPGFNSTQEARRKTSRLGQYAHVPDPIAVRHSIALRSSRTENADYPSGRGLTNDLDAPENWGEGDYAFGELPQGYLEGEEAEGLIPADTGTALDAQFVENEDLATIAAELSDFDTAVEGQPTQVEESPDFSRTSEGLIAERAVIDGTDIG